MVQLDNCDFLELSPDNPITGFDCGDSDINDFFNHDAMLFQRERLGQTYYFLARFLVVDAYNSDSVISFYLKNDFSFVFSTEQQEKENLKKMVAEDAILFTRQMFYDLERWKK